MVAATVESRAMRVVFTVEMQIPNHPPANMHRPYVCPVCAYSGGFESLGSIHGRGWCTFPNVIILARGIVRVYSLRWFRVHIVVVVVVVVLVVVVVVADFLVSMLTHSTGRTE